MAGVALSVRSRWLAMAAAAVCFGTVSANLGRPSFWIDELISFRIVDAASLSQVIANVIDAERRPPGYQILFWLWTLGASHTEWAARLFSGVWSVLTCSLCFALARNVSGHSIQPGQAATQIASRAAFIAVVLTCAHPLLVSYGQTVRYYSFIAAFAALAHLAFFKLLRRNARAAWVLHAAATMMLLYSDYASYGVPAAHNLIALLHAGRGAKPWRWFFARWLPYNALLAATLLPWVPVVLAQGQRDFGTADLANSLTGIVLKAGYPFYAWTIGENLFPWRPLALIGMTVACFGALLGAWHLARRNRWVITTLLIAFVAPFAFSQLLLNTVANDGPFVNAAARGMAGMSLFVAAIATGLAMLRTSVMQAIAVMALLAAHVAGTANYLAGREFFNPIYNTPAREVAQAIAREAQPGDIIVADSDTIVSHYLPDALKRGYVDGGSVLQTLERARANPSARIFVVDMGRDRTRNDAATNLRAQLVSERALTAETGFAAQDATYRAFKTRMLNREAYAHRLTLFQYAPAAAK